MVNAAIFAALAVLVGGWLLWHSSRHSYVTCGLFALLLIAAGGLGLTSLGNPKPMALQWPRLGKVTVAAYVLDEPNAIYLWLVTDGSAPQAFVLPWSTPTADALNSAGEQAKAQGTAVMMQMPGQAIEGTPSTERPMFYAAPQPPLPLKASPQ